MRTAALLLLCTAVVAASLALPARAQPAEPPPMRAVPLQRGERILLDGTLAHPAWQRAPVFAGFVEHDPRRGAEPPQATRVQLLYDDRALYVGIRALDDEPQRIRDQIVRFDQVKRTQDFVVVYIDAIGARQSAQWFRVNAGGSLADGMHTAADDSEDFAPDFDWDAAVARGDGGWTAVLRLPFASLRYAATSEHAEAPWRIMVARRLPREQFHLVTSVALAREAPSFVAALQRIDGLRLPERHQFLVLRPSLTWRTTRDEAAGEPPRRDSSPEASLDLKWRPRAELIVDATLNPDFSQVAIDVPQLAGNTRFALSLPEKRPFFFESSDLLRSPTEAFYTRSFTAPRWGLRGTWRGAGLAGSAFALDDRGGGLVLLPGAYGTGVAAQPGSRVAAARVLADRGALQLGALAIDRRYAGDAGDNRVAGPDLGWQITPHWRLRAQWLHASSTAQPDARGVLARGERRAGERVFAKVFFLDDDTDANAWVDELGDGFRHDSGFVNQSGVRKVGGFASRGWRGLGPFNEFWLNLEGQDVRARGSGERISAALTPGLWSTAARNLEWQLQYRGLSQLRTAPGAPLLNERYWYTSLIMTPATWFPLVDTNLSWGRLADTAAVAVRRGAKFNVTATLRPASRLELEPSLATAWLERGRDGGGREKAYRESVGQLLAVWHLDARSHLRLIVQQVSLDRRAEPGVAAERASQHTGSLTWTRRWSAGTVLYAGASRSRQGPGDVARGSEAFVKLQVDLDDARAAWR